MSIPVIHYFKFKPYWGVGRRPCGECGLSYETGEHIEVTVLKPYTSYICPEDNGAGLGHSSIWTGAYNVPELKSPNDDKCRCGATFVEEDKEQWTLTWELGSPGPWHPVSRTGSKRSTHAQYKGLQELQKKGEPIRNIELKKVQG